MNLRLHMPGGSNANGAMGGDLGDLGSIGVDLGDLGDNVAMAGASNGSDAIVGGSSGKGAMGGVTEDWRQYMVMAMATMKLKLSSCFICVCENYV